MKNYHLVVDVGNSNIVLGIFKEKKHQYDLVSSFRLVTPSFTTTDEMAIKIRDLLKFHKVTPEKIKRAVFISVVPSLNYNITKLLNLHFSIETLEVRHNMFKDIFIDYKEREDLGIDRLVNLKAASILVGLPVIVIDFGTATTIDVLDEKKHYLGGMIMPGISISLEALVERTSQLPSIDLQKPTKLLGKSTKESMQNGIFFLTSHGINNILESIIEKHFANQQVQIIYTGGFSSFITQNTKWKQHVIPSLTLVGGKILLDEFK